MTNNYSRAPLSIDGRPDLDAIAAKYGMSVNELATRTVTHLGERAIELVAADFKIDIDTARTFLLFWANMQH